MIAFEQPQSIRTIFFDAGFTLLHPSISTAEICQRVGQQLDLHIQLDAVAGRLDEADDFYVRQISSDRHLWASEKAISELWRGYYAHLLRPFIAEHDEQRLYQLADAITDTYQQHTSWQLYPDVLPVLETLRARGFYLGVISDWGFSLASILRQLHLTHYFDCLTISAVTRHAKPSPHLYERALQRANAIADYTIHIGDSYINDVLGARAVGMTPVLLDRARSLEHDGIDCLLVHSLYELLTLLEIPT